MRPSRVYRQEWSIAIGPFRMAGYRSLSIDWAERDDPSSRPMRAPWFRCAALLGIASVSMVAMATGTNLYEQHATVQAVPPVQASTAGTKRRHVTERRHHHRLGRAVSEPIAISPAIEDSAPAGREQAIAAAWSNGEAQEWAAEGRHGIVVPGPMTEAAGQRCRSFALLTRDGADGNVVDQWRRCVPG